MKFFYLICIYLLLTIILTFPSVLHLTDKIIGDGGDNYQFLSFQYLANRQLREGKNPLGWSNYWRYPEGFDFSLSYDSTLLIIIGLTLYRFSSNPIIIYNLSILLLVFFNGLLSYISFNKLLKNQLLGMIGSVIYGYSFYTLSKIGGHTNLILTSCFPFFAYSIVSIYENKGKIKDYIKLVLSIVIIFLTSLQYLLILLGSLVFFVHLSFLFLNKQLINFMRIVIKNRTKSIVSIIIVLSLFLAINFTRTMALFTGTLILPTEVFGSVPLINFFIPNSYLSTIVTFWSNNSAKAIESVIFLGYLEIIGLILFIFSKCEINKKIFIFSNIFIFFHLASGQELNIFGLSIYKLVYKFLPFRGISESNRFYIPLYFFITLAILLFLKRIKQKIILLLILVLIIFERIPKNIQLSKTHENDKFIEYIRKNKSEAVLDLPIFLGYEGSIYNLYSIYYQKPIVGGYMGWAGNSRKTLSFIKYFKSFSCNSEYQFSNINDSKLSTNNLLEILKNNRITILVIHKDLINTYKCEKSLNNINKLVYLSTGIDLIFSDKNKFIYELK